MKNLIDKYIEKFPSSVQMKLVKVREIIRKNAPLANEDIKYGMPTFILNGNLVHFAAFKNHLGFYPTPSAIKKFEKDLKKYKWSKGAIQFPLEEELPEELITKMVKYRVAENSKKEKI